MIVNIATCSQHGTQTVGLNFLIQIKLLVKSLAMISPELKQPKAKINGATRNYRIVGRYADSRHEDWREIGYKNWLNFEIARSKANRNNLIAVKLDQSYTAPDELYNAGAEWAYSFTENAIILAIDRAYS